MANFMSSGDISTSMTTPGTVFPERLFTEQAEYLAAQTTLTEKEAEAYLRRVHTPDEGEDAIADRAIARSMNVKASTFSKHLNNAKGKLQGDEAAINALETLFLTTDFGGVGGHSRYLIDAKRTSNAFILLTKTDFYDAEDYSFPSKYKAHIVYREEDPNIDSNKLPDDIIHYTKYSLFTVESSGRHHFLKSIIAYIDALDELDGYDLVTAIGLVEDRLDVSVEALDEETIETVRDASMGILNADGVGGV